MICCVVVASKFRLLKRLLTVIFVIEPINKNFVTDFVQRRQQWNWSTVFYIILITFIVDVYCTHSTVPILYSVCIFSVLIHSLKGLFSMVTFVFPPLLTCHRLFLFGSFSSSILFNISAILLVKCLYSLVRHWAMSKCVSSIYFYFSNFI